MREEEREGEKRERKGDGKRAKRKRKNQIVGTSSITSFRLMPKYVSSVRVTHMPKSNNNAIVALDCKQSTIVFEDVAKRMENTKYNVFICRQHLPHIHFLPNCCCCWFSQMKLKTFKWFSKRKWLLWNPWEPTFQPLLPQNETISCTKQSIFHKQTKTKKPERKYENEDVRCLFKFIPIIKCYSICSFGWGEKSGAKRFMTFSCTKWT